MFTLAWGFGHFSLTSCIGNAACLQQSLWRKYRASEAHSCSGLGWAAKRFSACVLVCVLSLLTLSGISSFYHRSWHLTAKGTPCVPQILFPKLCLASSQAKTFGKLGCWKISKKHQPVRRPARVSKCFSCCFYALEVSASNWVLLWLVWQASAQLLSPCQRHCLTKYWLEWQQQHSWGPAELKVHQPHHTVCTVLGGEQGDSSRYSRSSA